MSLFLRRIQGYESPEKHFFLLDKLKALLGDDYYKDVYVPFIKLNRAFREDDPDAWNNALGLGVLLLKGDSKPSPITATDKTWQWKFLVAPIDPSSLCWGVPFSQGQPWSSYCPIPGCPQTSPQHWPPLLTRQHSVLCSVPFSSLDSHLPAHSAGTFLSICPSPRVFCLQMCSSSSYISWFSE